MSKRKRHTPEEIVRKVLIGTLLTLLLPAGLAFLTRTPDNPAWIAATILALMGLIVFYYKADLRV